MGVPQHLIFQRLKSCGSNLHDHGSSFVLQGTICMLHETATYRCDDTRGCVMQFWPPDDEHMCSKHVETATYSCDDTRGCVMQFWPPVDEHMCSIHVEEWNKRIVKQRFCVSSWLITQINIKYVTKHNNCLYGRKIKLWFLFCLSFFCR